MVTHKAKLVSALSRTLAERLMLQDITIGRKGFLTYVKALAGSNVIKVVPAGGGASESQATGKRLKVVCGSNTSYLEDMAWVGDKTGMTYADVRVSPANAVSPNIGTSELSEALNRVLPFTAKEDNRPVLQCVLFTAKEGKLTLASADGFRLAIQQVDFDGEGEALILRDDLFGLADALRKARRANLAFEKSGEKLDGSKLVISTEAIRYSFISADGTFPEYSKLIPAEHKTVSHFDTQAVLKAAAGIKALASDKSWPVDLTLDNGMLTLSSPDDRGQAVVPADIEGEAAKVRLDGSYLTDAMKACNGMVDLKLSGGSSPVLFAVDGYQLVVMPMMTGESQKPETKAEASQPTETAEPEPEVAADEKAQAVAEAEQITKAEKPKHKAKRKVKEPVAV